MCIRDREEYESWVKQALRPEKYAEVVAAFGAVSYTHLHHCIRQVSDTVIQ